MKLNKQGKDELRAQIVEKLVNVPKGQRVHLDKELLEDLLFEEIVYNKETGGTVKLPIWSGDFLSKIDLSEISFENVAWDLVIDKMHDTGYDKEFDDETWKKFNNDSIYSLPNGVKVNYSNTNAKIQSFKGTTEIYYGAKPYLSGNEKYYPNSSIEKTLDTFHLNRTGKIYFADPMEQVSEKQKKEVDYVVYDNEPSYPNINEEVKKTYLTKTDENYRSRFEQIRDYFYRREMGGFANTDDAKKEQWKAAECIRIFDAVNCKGNVWCH